MTCLKELRACKTSMIYSHGPKQGLVVLKALRGALEEGIHRHNLEARLVGLVVPQISIVPFLATDLHE
jgi:hypothetical protein